MTPLEILKQAVDNMIKEFKEIHREAIKAGHAIDKMPEPTLDDNRLIRKIEKIADEMLAELELLQQKIKKWKSNRTRS